LVKKIHELTWWRN